MSYGIKYYLKYLWLFAGIYIPVSLAGIGLLFRNKRKNRPLIIYNLVMRVNRKYFFQIGLVHDLANACDFRFYVYLCRKNMGWVVYLTHCAIAQWLAFGLSTQRTAIRILCCRVRSWASLFTLRSSCSLSYRLVFDYRLWWILCMNSLRAW